MKQTSLLIALILFLGITQSCSTLKSPESEITDEPKHVATILGQPVTLNELQVGFSGNPDSNSVNVDELRDFLPSYIDYRLKIREGRQLGYFEDPDILAEYRTFAKESAKKQWINRDIEDRILDTFIKRSKKELLAYHILITAQNPDYEESREIKKQLSAAKKEILNGAEPDSVNVKYSSIENGNYAGGPLPWITAGRTVKSFEDVLYSLDVGEVSEPFQTQFGFHIIYLMDTRPRTPERHVSHLFVAKQGNENPEQLSAQALDSLKSGVEWSEVVNEFSDDRRTASRNGEIGWVGYGMQFPEVFVDNVMDVAVDSLFSDILEMDYGFHIVKVDSVRNFSDNKSLQDYAENELNRLGRLQPGEEELYELLTEYGNFQLFDEAFDNMANYLSGATDSLQNNSVIAEFNDKPILSGQFIEFYNQEADESRSILTAFEQYKNRVIELNLIDLTKERFNDYRFEMDQFLNGLVVFKINEEFLWNPDAADEQLMKNHFEQNRSEFVTEETITYYRITAATDSVISTVRDSLVYHGNPETVRETFDDVIVREGTATDRNPELFQTLKQVGSGNASHIEDNETWHQFYFVTNIEPMRPMSFEEAKTDIFNEVRELHEHNYLQELREKYQTELFPGNVQ